MILADCDDDDYVSPAPGGTPRAVPPRLSVAAVAAAGVCARSSEYMPPAKRTRGGGVSLVHKAS